MDNNQEVHTLANDIHSHEETDLDDKDYHQISYLIATNIVIASVSYFWSKRNSYLKAKLVEAVVEQVFDAVQETLVQRVTAGLGKDDWNRRRRALLLSVVMNLVPVHCRLKHQQHQDQQMILTRHNTELE